MSIKTSDNKEKTSSNNADSNAQFEQEGTASAMPPKQLFSASKEKGSATTNTGTKAGLQSESALEEEVPVQGKLETDFGEFKAPTYKKHGNSGAKIELEFHPNEKVDATKIGITQTAKSEYEGKNFEFSPTFLNRELDDGTEIDRFAERNNPIYGGQSLKEGEDLKDTKKYGGNFNLGTKNEKTGKWKPAVLRDLPRIAYGKESGQTFETTAFALEGRQKDMYYGSVKWGWEIDATGQYNLLPITLESKGTPSSKFFEAAKKWNDSASLGTIKTAKEETTVYNMFYREEFRLPKDTEVILGDTLAFAGDCYNKITDPSTGKTGRVKTEDLKDMGDGDATVDLPISTEATIDVPEKQGYSAALREDQSSESRNLADLPTGAKILIINDSSNWYKVQLDPNQDGVSLKGSRKRKKEAADNAGLIRGYVSKELIKTYS